MINSREQVTIQTLIDIATPEERGRFYAEAEEKLADANFAASRRFLTAEERKDVDVAVEMIVRVEATQQKKGAWFRFKRRLQVVQMYMGS